MRVGTELSPRRKSPGSADAHHAEPELPEDGEDRRGADERREDPRAVAGQETEHLPLQSAVEIGVPGQIGGEDRLRLGQGEFPAALSIPGEAPAAASRNSSGALASRRSASRPEATARSDVRSSVSVGLWRSTSSVVRWQLGA